MKNPFWSISFIGILALGIFAFSTSSYSSNEDDVLVGEITEDGPKLTAETGTLEKCFTRFDVFKDSRPHDFEIEYFEESDTYFLNAKGTSPKGKDMVMRVSLKSNSKRLVMSFSAFGESCTGDPCPNCSFADSGGCKCSTWLTGGKCNHTITKD